MAACKRGETSRTIGEGQIGAWGHQRGNLESINASVVNPFFGFYIS